MDEKGIETPYSFGILVGLFLGLTLGSDYSAWVIFPILIFSPL